MLSFEEEKTVLVILSEKQGIFNGGEIAAAVNCADVVHYLETLVDNDILVKLTSQNDEYFVVPAARKFRPEFRDYLLAEACLNRHPNCVKGDYNSVINSGFLVWQIDTEGYYLSVTDKYNNLAEQYRFWLACQA